MKNAIILVINAIIMSALVIMQDRCIISQIVFLLAVLSLTTASLIIVKQSAGRP